MPNPENPIIPEDAYSTVRADASKYVQTQSGFTLIEDKAGNFSLFFGETFLGTLATPGAMVYPANLVFSTYTLTTDTTIDAVDGTNPVNVTAAAIDEVNGWVYFQEDGTGNPRLAACKFDGSGLTALYSGGSPFALGIGPVTHQNAGGATQAWSDGTNLYISSDGLLAQTITLGDISQPNLAFAVSASGKYLAIVGANGTDSKKAQLQVWTGS